MSSKRAFSDRPHNGYQPSPRRTSPPCSTSARRDLGPVPATHPRRGVEMVVIGVVADREPSHYSQNWRNRDQVEFGEPFCELRMCAGVFTCTSKEGPLLARRPEDACDCGDSAWAQVNLDWPASRDSG